MDSQPGRDIHWQSRTSSLTVVQVSEHWCLSIWRPYSRSTAETCQSEALQYRILDGHRISWCFAWVSRSRWDPILSSIVPHSLSGVSLFLVELLMLTRQCVLGAHSRSAAGRSHRCPRRHSATKSDRCTFSSCCPSFEGGVHVAELGAINLEVSWPPCGQRTCLPRGQYL